MFTKRMLLLSVALWPVGLPAATLYYVDSNWTGTQAGTAAQPWQNHSSISWSAVSNSLSSADVMIYFSSHGSWSIGDLTIGTSGTAGHRLYLIGDTYYNTNTTGTAAWVGETGGKRATLAGGASIYANNGQQFTTIRGFAIKGPTWGGINLGQANPTLNIHDIEVLNCLVDTPANNHGIWFGFAETNCYNVRVSGCVVSNTPLESIYMGHYSYLSGTITGIVIESNTVVNCGLGGEGDIDIKPGCRGAIIRFNTHYRAANTNGSNCGTVVAATDCQIYGNTFYAEQRKSSAGNDWGYGIYLNADGDGVGNGSAVTNCLIYNNVMYANTRNAIRCSAAYADLTGVRVYNNTMWGNAVDGFEARQSNGHALTIVDFLNNLIGSNVLYEIQTYGSVTFSHVDNNVYYRPSGNNFSLDGAEQTWAQWQARGFDSHGTNGVAPVFAGAGDFHLGAGSVGLNLGANLSAVFTGDRAGAARPASGAWDAGAYQHSAGQVPGPPILNVAP